MGNDSSRLSHFHCIGGIPTYIWRVEFKVEESAYWVLLNLHDDDFNPKAYRVTKTTKSVSHKRVTRSTSTNWNFIRPLDATLTTPSIIDHRNDNPFAFTTTAPIRADKKHAKPAGKQKTSCTDALTPSSPTLIAKAGLPCGNELCHPVVTLVARDTGI